MRWPFRHARPHLRRALIVLTAQLQQLLQASMPLPEALRLLYQTLAQPLAREIAERLWRGIEEGQAFHQVMMKHPHYFFQPLWVQIMAVSSQTGQLLLGLEAWHGDLVQQNKLRQQWRQVLAYPCMLMVVCVGVLVALLGWVLPHFAVLFDQMQAPLPVAMQRALALVEGGAPFDMAGWWMVCIAVLVGMGVWYVCHGGDGVLGCRVPVVGRMLRQKRLCQQLHVLHLLAKANMPWPQGVALMAMEVHATQSHWQRCYQAILAGQPLHRALQVHPDFDPMLCACLSTAEHSGQLTATLAHLAAQHTDQLAAQLKTLQTTLMPWMTLCMGAVVAALMVCMYMPLLQLGDALWSVPMST